MSAPRQVRSTTGGVVPTNVFALAGLNLTNR